MRWKKSASFSTNNGRTSRLSSFYRIIVNHKNFILKYLDNTFKFLLNFTNIEAAILEEKAPLNDFGRTVPSAEKYGY